MRIVLGTDDGVWTLDGESAEQVALAGFAVCHVAAGEAIDVAAVAHDGLYEVTPKGQRRLWQGDARACAIAPDGTIYLGTEPAMIFRSTDRGGTWRRSDAIDDLPTRKDWYFPVSPREPHVRSIDVLPGAPDSVLVGVEVGGVVLSKDSGETWRELKGVHADVHNVRPDHGKPGRLLAATGGGLYASEDEGASWERRMRGLDATYCVGLYVNPSRAGEVLAAVAQGPPGVDARVYCSRNGGTDWQPVTGAPLPMRYDRVPVVFFTSDAAFVLTSAGDVFTADDALGNWRHVLRVPASILTAAAAGGCPSSISAGR
ncbi:MAG: WD40/YVTN/BNR-like repeat-containing protein [Alphaproteobacteria bacterium]